MRHFGNGCYRGQFESGKLRLILAGKLAKDLLRPNNG